MEQKINFYDVVETFKKDASPFGHYMKNIMPRNSQPIEN